MSERLARVYDFQNRLRAIWRLPQRSASQLSEALEAWCQDARTSGIATLEQFAERLQLAVRPCRIQ